MSINSDNLSVPQPTKLDAVYATGEALANILPFAGPELFRLIVSSPLESRRNKWMQEVSLALQELYNKDLVNITEISNNEEFVSFMMQTSRIAIGQHEQEKLNYLKNALLNSILQDISYDVKCAYINAVEQLSPRHILFLKHIRDKHSNRGPHITMKADLIEEASKLYFDYDKGLADAFFGMLMNLSLVTRTKLPAGFKPNETIDHFHLTTWGEQFLKFISEV